MSTTRYEPHTNPLVVVCRTCSKPDCPAVIPQATITAHELWHQLPAMASASQPAGPWPQLAENGTTALLERPADPLPEPPHVVSMWRGSSAPWFFATCQREDCPFSLHTEDPEHLVIAVAAHLDEKGDGQ